MNAIKQIRQSVFKMTQAQFAEVAGVTQSTVSRWDRGERSPGQSEMDAIRALAKQRRIRWSDKWFFDGPPGA